MSAVSTALMTAEEFFEWANRPENAQARMHVHRGRVFPLPPPSAERQAVTHLLAEYCIKQRRGEVAWQTDGVVFERDPLTVFMPDVMLFNGVSNADDFQPRFSTDTPVLIVEVVGPRWSSPSLDRAGDAITRGVGEVWFLIPEERCLIRCQPKRSPKVLDAADTLTGNDILPDFSCRVADFFSPPTA